MGHLRVYQIYRRLLTVYGPQFWWPGDSDFEVMVGAILTQNTSWVNVERAIHNLKQANLLSVTAIVNVRASRLARLLKPAGYFNLKTERLKNFCRWLKARGGQRKLQALSTVQLRKALLEVNGVGPETADAILLYAFRRPVFVIDAYTKRIFLRLGMVNESADYEGLRAWFEQRLSRVSKKVPVFNEYHALIVEHAKQACRHKPLCEGCCLQSACSFARNKT